MALMPYQFTYIVAIADLAFSSAADGSASSANFILGAAPPPSFK